MKNQIDIQKFLKVFYISGAIIFSIAGIANIFTNYNYWPTMIFSAKVSAVVNNMFNFILAIFFFVYYKSTLQKTQEPLKTEEIEKAFDNFKSQKVKE